MNKRTKLFCFPHAGGLSSTYFDWKEYLDDNIELIPIELSGRGSRINTKLYVNMEEAVEDLYSLLSRHLDGSPFAMFGHSFGTLLVYELTKRIQTMNSLNPIHLFFSGRMPIHVKDKNYRHTLSDRELKDYILNLGGVQPFVAEFDEVLEVFLPMIRADFKVAESYEYKNEDLPFNFDISVLYGISDHLINPSRLTEWTYYSNRKCEIHSYQGGHFFLNEHKLQVTSLINNTLNKK